MNVHDIVVIGTSAGRVTALKKIVSGLPGDFPGSIFIVIHIGIGMNGHSNLDSILQNAGRLPVRFPKDGESVDKGTIYIAPPDRHMLLSEGHLHVCPGPKVNFHRPAINPLFRSAAEVYRSRKAGVILTGMLDDGTAGLAAVKRCGGVAVVQNPASAEYNSMPLSANRHVEVDHLVELDDIAGLIVALSATPRKTAEREEPLERERSELTCPECRGPLWRETQGKVVEYTCRVGHTYSPLALASEHRETIERTLWSALVSLEEATQIAEKLVPEAGEEMENEAKNRRKQAATLRRMLEGSD